MQQPTVNLRATIREWGRGASIHRIHSEIYDSIEFNSSDRGSARFSPLRSDEGKIIPTLYAGSTLDCALMETIFHDVPFVSGPKPHSKAKHVAGKVHSVLRISKDLRLIDLSAIPLRRLGISPKDLILSESSTYPETRVWASALYGQCSQAQGLMWTSRQDDTASAFMFFGDRMPIGSLKIESPSNSLLLADGAPCDEVLSMASRLDVLLV